jgi:hypothetical protein
MGDLECNSFPSELADMTEVELYDTCFAFETDGLQGHSLVNQYSIGDRVLLTVSVAAGGLGTSDAGEAEADPGLAHLAIQAQIDKLAAAGLT